MTMLRRHLIALFITVGIYYSPYAIPCTENGFWIRSCALSLYYIMLIDRFAKTRISALILSTEFIAMFWNFCAALEYFVAPESQLFNDHYGHIMSYCYVLQVLIIMGGATGGRFKRIYHLWQYNSHGGLHDSRSIFISESYICKIGQKVSHML